MGWVIKPRSVRCRKQTGRFIVQVVPAAVRGGRRRAGPVRGPARIGRNQRAPPCRRERDDWRSRLRGDREYFARPLALGSDENAFEALVRRHGPMVLALCRRILRDPQDAEDAFQAAFLVFVRKAASTAKPELLGDWLYGVASRTARAARAAAEKRRVKEAEAVPREQPAQESPRLQ